MVTDNLKRNAIITLNSIGKTGLKGRRDLALDCPMEYNQSSSGTFHSIPAASPQIDRIRLLLASLRQIPYSLLFDESNFNQSIRLWQLSPLPGIGTGSVGVQAKIAGPVSPLSV